MLLTDSFNHDGRVVAVLEDWVSEPAEVELQLSLSSVLVLGRR